MDRPPTTPAGVHDGIIIDDDNFIRRSAVVKVPIERHVVAAVRQGAPVPPLGTPLNVAGGYMPELVPLRLRAWLAPTIGRPRQVALTDPRPGGDVSQGPLHPDSHRTLPNRTPAAVLCKQRHDGLIHPIGSD